MANIPRRSRWRLSDLSMSDLTAIASAIVAAMLLVTLFPAVILDPPAIMLRCPLACIAFANLVPLFESGRRRSRPADRVWMDIGVPVDPAPAPLTVIDDHRV